VDEGSSTVRWATGNAFSPGFDALPNGAGLPTTVNPAAGANNAAFHPRFPRFDIYKDDQKRLGGTLSLQWRRPTRPCSASTLYADFKGTREEQYLEAPSFSVGGACTAANVSTSCGIAQTQVVSATIDSKNTMTKGTFNNVDLRVEDRFDKLDTKFTQFGLSGAEFTDDIKIDGLIGHSKSDHQNPIQTTVQFDQFNVQGYSYDYSNGRLPVIGYGSAKLTDPIGLGADPDPHPAAVGGQHLRRRPAGRHWANLGDLQAVGPAGRSRSTSSRPPSCAARTAPAPIWSRPCRPPWRPSTALPTAKSSTSPASTA
jgi:iron complex outermembrane receptor protein